jgi:hypothetical protein
LFFIFYFILCFNLDAAPYVLMADEFGYDVEIVDVDSEEFNCADLAKRNIHNVSEETILQLLSKREKYSVNDARNSAKQMKKDSKEGILLRKKWASKLQKQYSEKLQEKEKTIDDSNSEKATKIRLEVCANNGQANPVKVTVIGFFFFSSFLF